MMTKLSSIMATCGVVLTMSAVSLGQAAAEPPATDSPEPAVVAPTTTLSDEELKDVYRDVANDLDKALADLESAESRAAESARSSAAPPPASSETSASVAVSSTSVEPSSTPSDTPPSTAATPEAVPSSSTPETSAAPGAVTEVVPFYPPTLPMKDICAGKGVQAYLIDEPGERTKHARVSIGVSGCARKKDTAVLITLPNTNVLNFEKASYSLYAPGGKEEIGTIKADGTLVTVRFSKDTPDWHLTVHAAVEQTKDGPITEKVLVDGKRFELFFGQKVSHCGSECQASHPRGYAAKWSHFSTETVELFSVLQGVPSKDGSFTITDTVPGGSAKFVCSSLLHKAHSNTGRNEGGIEQGEWLPRDAKVSCDDNKASVEWPEAKAGERYAIYIKSNPVTRADGLDARNRACYLDKATFTGVDEAVQAAACMPNNWSSSAYSGLPAAATTTTLTPAAPSSQSSSSKASSSGVTSSSAAASSSAVPEDSSTSALASSTSSSAPAEPSSESSSTVETTTSVVVTATTTVSTATTSPAAVVPTKESSSATAATSTKSATPSTSRKAAPTHNPPTTHTTKPSGDRGRLASTGANVLWLILGAVVVLGVGVAIVLWARRSRK